MRPSKPRTNAYDSAMTSPAVATHPKRTRMTWRWTKACFFSSPKHGSSKPAITTRMTAREKAPMSICPGTMGPKFHTPYGIATRIAVQIHQPILLLAGAQIRCKDNRLDTINNNQIGNGYDSPSRRPPTSRHPSRTPCSCSEGRHDRGRALPRESPGGSHRRGRGCRW